jgi:N-acetylglucosaminyl-diphospho-decaprenol L-rhamnosyltransferase
MITISLVSHDHDAWLPRLLRQLADSGEGLIAHVILTHNLPAIGVARAHDWPFRLTEIHNASPVGFGANHNRAFARVDTTLFCVLNPDLSFPDRAIWQELAQQASAPGVGCAFPVLQNADGTLQDSVRAVVTPWALLRRRILRLPDQRKDWASAAFWMLPSAVFRRLGGFDERYHMYCEDVDFCLRLQIAGLTLKQVPAHAVHAAQRDSHRRWQHLAWHVQSLFRLWTGSVLRTYLRLDASAPGR